jgi:pyruvate,water dikinase
MEERVDSLQAKSDALHKDPDRFKKRVALVHELVHAFPFVVPQVFSAAFGGLIPLGMLNWLYSHLPESERGEESGRENLALEINRGLPHNVTTEMDLTLWETARTIQGDEETMEIFKQTEVSKLAGDYLHGRLPRIAQEGVTNFLTKYGMRGFGELDIGHPRWSDEPAHIIKMIQGYLLIEDQSQAPDVVFARGEEAAREAAFKLESAVRQTRGGVHPPDGDHPGGAPGQREGTGGGRDAVRNR